MIAIAVQIVVLEFSIEATSIENMNKIRRKMKNNFEFTAPNWCCLHSSKEQSEISIVLNTSDLEVDVQWMMNI